MRGPTRVVVIGAGLVEEGRPVDAGATPIEIDAERLRRMDRFGRCGFLAGSLALAEALGRRAAPGGAPDGRRGVVFGSAFGCRDSIVDHARALALAAFVDDLSPGVFAETVHNTVNGELAIDWLLGGLSEVFVSGRAAGLEAILAGAEAIETGTADLVVAGGAEGLHDAMREAFAAESGISGRARRVELRESGAALVLASEQAAEEAGARVLAAFTAGARFFEPDDARAAERLGGLLGAPAASGAARFEEPDVERFAAGGPFSCARLVRLLAAHRVDAGVVVARDPAGGTVAALFGRA